MRNLSLLLLSTLTLANAENGPWTGHDWYDPDNHFGVKNGIMYSNAGWIQRRLDSTKVLVGNDQPDIDWSNPANNPENVHRFMRICPYSVWDEIFSNRNPIYDYHSFTNAVASYPTLCNENNSSNFSDDEMCARELATMFAHMEQETSLLHYTTELACTPTNLSHSACNYKSTNWSESAWPPVSGVQYYGRGPFQLTWNYNYGPFSSIAYNDKEVLLKDPDLVATNGRLSMMSAFWFYMTPQSPKPSMHDVVTKYWYPNSSDSAEGLTSGFGSTINIINGGECGYSCSAANNRKNYYENFLRKFGLNTESYEDCTNQRYFPSGGDQVISQYLDYEPIIGHCKVVSYATEWTIWNENDYKNCVEHFYGNQANEDSSLFLE